MTLHLVTVMYDFLCAICYVIIHLTRPNKIKSNQPANHQHLINPRLKPGKQHFHLTQPKSSRSRLQASQSYDSPRTGSLAAISSETLATSSACCASGRQDVTCVATTTAAAGPLYAHAETAIDIPSSECAFKARKISPHPLIAHAWGRKYKSIMCIHTWFALLTIEKSLCVCLNNQQQ